MCTLYNNIVLFVYGVLCVVLSTRKSYYYRYNIAEVRVGEALCIFVVYLFNPHAFLSFRLSPTHSTVVHTSHSGADHIKFHNVIQFIGVRACCVSRAHKVMSSCTVGHAMLFVCTRSVVCVYYFFLLVHFLCRLSPLR